MSAGGPRAVLVAALLLAACAPAARPAVPTSEVAALPDWKAPGFEGPLVEAAPRGEKWSSRGRWEAFDGRAGAVFLGPPRTSPPSLPELLAAFDPDAVPAALPGGEYWVFDAAEAPLWYRRFARTGQHCVAFVRTSEAASDTGAWGYYCAAPGQDLSRQELTTALAAIRWQAGSP